MRSNLHLLRKLLAEAEHASSLLLPRLEPHPAGLVLTLVGTGLGLASTQASFRPYASALGWVAMSLVVLGMLMFQWMLRKGLGWRVDIPARRLQPEGMEGQAVTLQGEGWSLFCVAGSKRRSLALEFRHVDGGPRHRIFQTRGGAGRDEHRLTSELADRLAQRLGVGRGGLSL